eukprot:gene13465-48868_t
MAEWADRAAPAAGGASEAGAQRCPAGLCTVCRVSAPLRVALRTVVWRRRWRRRCCGRAGGGVPHQRRQRQGRDTEGRGEEGGGGARITTPLQGRRFRYGAASPKGGRAASPRAAKEGRAGEASPPPPAAQPKPQPAVQPKPKQQEAPPAAQPKPPGY